jgi:hypothetical protein
MSGGDAYRRKCLRANGLCDGRLPKVEKKACAILRYRARPAARSLKAACWPPIASDGNRLGVKYISKTLHSVAFRCIVAESAEK